MFWMRTAFAIALLVPCLSTSLQAQTAKRWTSERHVLNASGRLMPQQTTCRSVFPARLPTGRLLEWTPIVIVAAKWGYGHKHSVVL